MQAYILADTTYNSLSVDETAAAHVNADCIIHYGRASLTKLSKVPAFFVFPEELLDVEFTVTCILRHGEKTNTTLCFLDQEFISQVEDLEIKLISHNSALVFPKLPVRELLPSLENADDNSTSIAGYSFSKSITLEKCAFIWVGAMTSPALQQLHLTFNESPWLHIDPIRKTVVHDIPPEIDRLLKRRYYLVEKARNAKVVGIVMGTLGIAGYRDALSTLQSAARTAGKKVYTFLMGKPCPAKLANFPEVEIFILVADPQGQILDSKDYLAPIITSHEAMLAFTGTTWDRGNYRLDFDSLDQNAMVHQGPRFSLLDGQHHELQTTVRAGDDCLAIQAQQALLLTHAPNNRSDLVAPASAADYMVHKRTWKGVDAPMAGAGSQEATAAVPGRTGRAVGYDTGMVDLSTGSMSTI